MQVGARARRTCSRTPLEWAPAGRRRSRSAPCRATAAWRRGSRTMGRRSRRSTSIAIFDTFWTRRDTRDAGLGSPSASGWSRRTAARSAPRTGAAGRASPSRCRWRGVPAQPMSGRVLVVDDEVEMQRALARRAAATTTSTCTPWGRGRRRCARRRLASGRDPARPRPAGHGRLRRRCARCGRRRAPR